MITKEELAKLSRDKVSALFYEKRNACRTCAQFGEMIFNDKEYIMIKERLSEFYIEDKRKNEQRKKAQAIKEFVEKLKAKAHSVVGFNVLKKVYAKEYTINEIDIDELLKEYEQ